MKKNVILLVMDGLSKELLNLYSHENPDNFYEKLQSVSFMADYMYSSGPFTEAAIQGLLMSQRPCDNREFVWNKFCGNESIFSIFKKNGYTVFDVCPNYLTIEDENAGLITREHCDTRIKLFMARYFDLVKGNEAKHNDVNIWKKALDYYFKYSGWDTMEAEQYYQDGERYIRQILKQKYNHPLSRILMPELFEVKEEIFQILSDAKRAMPSEEVLLSHKIRVKNAEIYQHLVQRYGRTDTLERNRELKANNDACVYLFKNNKRKEFLNAEAKLLQFIDTKPNQPFFAYFHVYDMHYPEAIMETAMGEQGWENEIIETNSILSRIRPEKSHMSVSKHITIEKLSRKLARLFQELQERGIFEDTYVILTADHGIANMMHPLGKGDKWDFCNAMFHIPFYLLGAGIKAGKASGLRIGADILPTLAELCHLEYDKSNCIGKNLLCNSTLKYVLTEWINGAVDISRQPIKYGVRNEHLSITIEGCVHQFFESCRIVSVYDLKQDPEELYNLVEMGKSIPENEWEEFLLLLTKVRNRHLEISLDYFEGKHLCFPQGDSRIAALLRSKKHYCQLFGSLAGNTWQEFDQEIKHKKLYLFGASRRSEVFLEKYADRYAVEAIFDNSDVKNGIVMFHCRVMKPFKFTELDNTDKVILITSTYDISILAQLQALNVSKVFIFNQLENSLILTK